MPKNFVEEIRMNHKIEKPHKLLGPDGSLLEPGWANRLIMEYSPFDVKAHKIRIKEWDYYIIIDDDGYALSATIADNRYMGLANANFFDFNEGKKYPFITPMIFPMGRLNMPTDSSKGDIFIRMSSCSLSVSHEKGGRHLVGHYKKSALHGEMDFDIFLYDCGDDTMVIATPWKEDKTAFYYNQKINCMPAEGYVKINGKTHKFSADKNFGTLDWGRGVWTYDNTWYWGSGNGVVNGKRFGYNIGYGFGDTTAASENMIFYDGMCHKFDRILFEIPDDDIMKPWKFISSDGRFEMDFQPVYDNVSRMSALLISQHSHQVFGRVSGKAVLDSGETLEIKNLLSFAERVRNRY